MASRQNREARDEIPTYGAPMDVPAPNPDRDRERKEKLESKPSDKERRRLIEEHEERGQEETAKARRDRGKRTEAPKPAPYTTVGEPEGRPTVDIISERDKDIEDTLHEIETGEKPEEE